jgi:aminoglycoside phosphotransferase (APT) family kinase protein
MTEHAIDRPTEVREGAGFDVDALRRHMDVHLPTLAGPIVVQQYPSGFSNLTYLLRVGDGDKAQEVVLRRAPPGVKIKSAHDMGREHRILTGLSRIWDKVPEPLHLCEDTAVLGSGFYLMRPVTGIILRGRVPEGLSLEPPRMRRIAEAAVDTLAEIHGLDLEAAGLAELGRPKGYATRQIEGWTRRYERAKTDDIAGMDRVAQWLANRIPTDDLGCLVHNDFKYDNMVLDPADPTKVRAVLDWEMATAGHPLMDLGVMLAYWIRDEDHPVLQAFKMVLTGLDGNLTRGEVVARYAAQTGHDVSNIVWHYVYALYKVAVVVQQLYARHVAGLSSDPRHAQFIHGVRGFAAVAELAIAKDAIEGLV